MNFIIIVLIVGILVQLSSLKANQVENVIIKNTLKTDKYEQIISFIYVPQCHKIH